MADNFHRNPVVVRRDHKGLLALVIPGFAECAARAKITSTELRWLLAPRSLAERRR